MKYFLVLWAVTLLEFKECRGGQLKKNESVPKDLERKGTIHIAGPWHSESALDRNIDAAEDSYVKKIISSNEGLNFNKDMAEAGEEFELNGIDDFYDKTASITYEINGHEIPVHLKPKLTPQTKPMFPEYVKELPSVPGSSRHNFQLGEEPNHPENLYSNFSPKELPEYNFKDSPSFNPNAHKNNYNSKNNVNRVSNSKANYKHFSDLKLPWKYADSFATGENIGSASRLNQAEQNHDEINFDQKAEQIHKESNEESAADETSNLNAEDHKDGSSGTSNSPVSKKPTIKKIKYLTKIKSTDLKEKGNNTNEFENDFRAEETKSSSKKHKQSLKDFTTLTKVRDENDTFFLNKLENLHKSVLNAKDTNQPSKITAPNNDSKTSAEKTKTKERILFLLSDLTAKLKGIENFVTGQINKTTGNNTTNLQINHESLMPEKTDVLNAGLLSNQGNIQPLSDLSSIEAVSTQAQFGTLSPEATEVQHEKESVLYSEVKNANDRIAEDKSLFAKFAPDDARLNMEPENSLSELESEDEVQRGVGEKIKAFVKERKEKVNEDVASTTDLDNDTGNKNDYIYESGASNEEKQSKEDFVSKTAENSSVINELANGEDPFIVNTESINFLGNKDTADELNGLEQSSEYLTAVPKAYETLKTHPAIGYASRSYTKGDKESRLELKNDVVYKYRKERKPSFPKSNGGENQLNQQKSHILNLQNSSMIKQNLTMHEKSISTVNIGPRDSTEPDVAAGRVRSFKPSLSTEEILYPNYDDVKEAAVIETTLQRKKFHGNKLEWSDTLSDKAQKQADLLARKIDFDINKDDQFRLPGENVALIKLDSLNVGKEAVDSWANEAKDYDFKSPLITKKNGDFVQLMWKSNKQFGMGVSKSKAGNGWIVTSFYDSPFVDRYNDLKNNIESDVPIDDPYSDITG